MGERAFYEIRPADVTDNRFDRFHMGPVPNPLPSDQPKRRSR